MTDVKPYSATEGFIVGLIGYAVVILVVGILDLALGRSLFHTPALLGHGFAADPDAAGAVSTAPVLAWNSIHMVAFLVVGIAIAQLTRMVELHPAVWYLAGLILLFGFVVAIYVISTLGATREAVPWWTVFVATSAAMLAMGLYVSRRHPEVGRGIRELGEAGP